MNRRILFKLTTRERPERALQCLDAFYSKMSINPNYLTRVTLDTDDKSCNNTDFLSKLVEYPKLSYYLGFSKNKVDAINRDVKDCPWDILINISDDQIFHTENFDQIIREQFQDTLDQVLHVPDNHNPELLTMSIIGRDYYNRDGYVYHPSYVGLYCDNEAQQVANLRGKLVKLNQNLFNHNHPNYGIVERDDQYKRYDHWEGMDKRNFEKRLRNNFGL